MPRLGHYEILPGLLLGFHGTDRTVVERVLCGECHLEPSNNSYDWLGNGVYFWEYSPRRAFDFAVQASRDGRSSRGVISDPAVIGAVIDPGRCLNLLEASALDQLRQSYMALSENKTTAMPKNVGGIDRRQGKTGGKRGQTTFSAPGATPAKPGNLRILGTYLIPLGWQGALFAAKAAPTPPPNRLNSPHDSRHPSHRHRRQTRLRQPLERGAGACAGVGELAAAPIRSRWRWRLSLLEHNRLNSVHERRYARCCIRAGTE
ncbi:hypothetical protein Thiowin_04122 [Thiorhodovibrio winogradskyi]|uniref:Uncharacterized protein n=1 Tax=Thiorhodovibrio winogradskyi TaxID=77007 RepID=A0ABZ0SFE3_9GAMM